MSDFVISQLFYFYETLHLFMKLCICKVPENKAAAKISEFTVFSLTTFSFVS